MKLNNVVYKKLVLQAEEAKEIKLTKLASAVLNGVGAVSRDEDEKISFSSSELEESVYNSLWKVAVDILSYHDLESADIQKIDEAVQVLAGKVIREVEGSLSVSGKIGPLEPKLPGEVE